MNVAIATTLAHGAQHTVEELETEITTLAAHLNAATYRFLVLIADFNRREGWGGWGIRSCAHWLNWKCGIGLVAAREKLRVAHALESLPRISDAMQQGVLSYTKVRAMTRIATRENECFLLTIAENGTATHVEATVRHYRRTHRIEELERDNARHVRRCLRYYWDDDGSLVIEGRLPPEQGAVVVKALDAADQALRQACVRQRCDSAEEPTAGEEAESGIASRAAAKAPDSQNDCTKMSATTSRPDLLTGGAASVRRDEGHHSLLLEAVKMLETAERQTSHASAEAEPSDSESASAEALSFARPQTETNPALHPSADAPLAEAPSWGNRQADAFALMAETFLASGPVALHNGDKHLVHIHIDLSVLGSQNTASQSAIEDGPALPPETVRRLCCDGGLVTWLKDAGRTLDVGRKTRAIPSALRRALDERDRGCRFPGCQNRRFVDAHHVEHWVDGGETRIDNLVTLCRYHHRLIHEGGFRIERPEGKLRFARPDGRLIPEVPALTRARDGTAALKEKHKQMGLRIDARTAIPHWGGERADYGYMLVVLDQCDERASQ